MPFYYISGDIKKLWGYYYILDGQTKHMDTADLLEIYRKEKMSPYLCELEENFYSEVDGIIKELESQYEERRDDRKSSGKLLKELENVKTVVEELYEIRERKVVLGALNYVRREGGDIDLDNLTTQEEKMLEDVAGILNENRKEIHEGGGANKAKKPPKKKNPPREKKDAKIALITIRITKELPSIVGADGKVYGAFVEEDVVTLPGANARALIEQGAAEEIKL